MSVTVLVHGPTPRPNMDDAFAITLDAPRIVLGRSEGSEVRIPDPSISSRHATLRQRGAEYMLVDEGSTNGTRMGRVILAPQSPRLIKNGEMAKLGRVWVEFRIEPKPPSNQPAVRAKELALALVEAALVASGEDGRPRVFVEGASERAEEEISVRIEAGSRVVAGRSKDTDLCIDDPELSRRHLEIGRKGDVLVVRDLGSKTGTRLGDKAVETGDVVWKSSDPLLLGSTVLRYQFEAREVLAEIERAPDEKLASRELEMGNEAESVIELPADPSSVPDDFDSVTPELVLDPSPPPPRVVEKSKWGITDFAVMALALGVFSLSAVGYFVLLR